jgi:hypothetical protein
MHKRFLPLVALGLGLSLLAARAGTPGAAATEDKHLPGKQVAQTISLITGVAISPLMGVGAVGAWQYFQAQTPEQKAQLPWFANPWFWGAALLLVMMCFVKDSAGVALPAVLKKPFDVAETLEHKISGLVATGAFVPIAAAIFHSSSVSGDGAGWSAAGFAAIDLSWFYNALLVPAAMAAFFIVFLASNAVNTLILLSPFPVLDAALKVFRTSIIASIAISSWANPWIGAVWALVVIAFCYLIAGWSFRLSYFGLVFVWDFVTRRGRRFTPDLAANKMFLGRTIDKVPARTYGKLSRDEKGRLIFRYRPWLVLPGRTLALPEARYAVGQGAFFSEIFQLDGDGERIAFLLPPRYRSHEEQLVTLYGLVGVRPTGLRAAWQWLKSLFGGKTPTVAAA